MTHEPTLAAHFYTLLARIDLSTMVGSNQLTELRRDVLLAARTGAITSTEWLEVSSAITEKQSAHVADYYKRQQDSSRPK